MLKPGGIYKNKELMCVYYYDGRAERGSILQEGNYFILLSVKKYDAYDKVKDTARYTWFCIDTQKICHNYNNPKFAQKNFELISD